jgi:membrane protease YdiL (CAAX protease family)
MDDSTRARRQALRYIALVLAISFALEAYMIRSAGGLRAFGGYGPFVLMWVPAILSLVVRLVGREGFRDAGWRLRPVRYLLWGYLIPAGCGLLTYGLAWAFGVVSFDPPAKVLAAGGSPHLRWLASAGINASLGMLIASLASFGEELGWRGYLVTRLVDGRVPLPLTVSGLVWGVWHLPMILFGDYATSQLPWLSGLQFMVVVTLAAIVIGWLRLASGSFWPAVIAHSAHNVFYQGILDRWLNGPLEPYFAGEQGVFSMLAYALVVLVLWRRGQLRAAERQK